MSARAEGRDGGVWNKRPVAGHLPAPENRPLDAEAGLSLSRTGGGPRGAGQSRQDGTVARCPRAQCLTHSGGSFHAGAALSAWFSPMQTLSPYWTLVTRR